MTHRARPRHGAKRGWWIVLGVVALALVGVAFGLGLLVGRHSTRQPSSVTAEPARKPATAPRRGGLTEAQAERVVARQEKLTFYQTLTAPMAPVSLPPKPDVAPKPEPPVKANPRTEPEPHTATEDWTVQVGVFKNTPQAERLRKELADSGFPARVTPAAGEDGQARYRVRVGAYRTRADAVKIAERLRSERSLPTYVTPK